MVAELAELALNRPHTEVSPEASELALSLALCAWNESVGLHQPRECYRNTFHAIEAKNPQVARELKSTDVDLLFDELVRYKKSHYPKDKRRILACTQADGKLRVEWLKPAGRGVDSKSEMQLFGLVRTGKIAAAVRFLEESVAMSRADALERIALVARQLGMR